MSRFSIKVFWSEANQGIWIIYSYGRFTSPPPQNFSWVFGKMGCLGNSKTEDQRNEEKAQREANKKIEKQLQKDKQIYRATHRLLLLGRLVWKLRFFCHCCKFLLDALTDAVWRHRGLVTRSVLCEFDAFVRVNDVDWDSCAVVVVWTPRGLWWRPVVLNLSIHSHLIYVD